MKLYSYVVHHDTGLAPNPYSRVCTLCRCKYRKPGGTRRNIVELAEEGDWVVGTGGADKRKSAGHGKLVYAMRVDKKLTREEYYACPRFKAREDNEPPKVDFEKPEQFVLISRHFYYFGANAIDIPFPKLEKRGPWFRSDFDPEFIRRFVEWLERQGKPPGKHGEPCQKDHDKPKGSKTCKSSC
ncbi:MAG: hypothetical protein ABSE56_18265 [Bryobacteraceae bacterium]|jgi:hypothetical protein